MNGGDYSIDGDDVAGFIGVLLRNRLDQELRNQMGAAARDRVERYFTWERHVRILERSVRNALGEAVELKEPISLPAFGRNGSTPMVAHQPVGVAEMAEMETAPLPRG